MRAAISASSYEFDRKKRIQKLLEIINYCENAYKAGRGIYATGANPPRILVSGAALDGVSEKTIDVIEELGGAIVCYEGCSGVLSMRRLIDEDENKDPIEVIAEKYLEVPCAVVSPNDRRMRQVAETIDEWNIDGVISITVHACAPFSVEATKIQKVCEEKGTPFLRLTTDYSPGDEGQLRTRIEAFIEMLIDKKKG